MTNTILFIRGSIHQGHQRFSVLSRGRQCSFMSLFALLYAQVHPVRQWGRYTINQILIEGDRMYLNALDNHEIPDSETISLQYLPNRLNCSSSFLQTSALSNDVSLGTTTTELPISTSNQYLKSHRKSPKSPDFDLPDVVENNEAKYESISNTTKSPNVVTNIDLPDVVEPNAATSKTNAKTMKSPDVVTNIELPDMLQTNDGENHNNNRWLINYKQFYQGRISCEDINENVVPYFTLRSALMNTFLNNNYAFIILDGYIMALIKSVDCMYVFDSHARNCFGMPDENGTAVVMKCADIDTLVEFIHSLSFQLQTDLFEILPVAFYKEQYDNQVLNPQNTCRNTFKRKISERNAIQLVKNRLKDKGYRKRRLSHETEFEREVRLDNKKSCQQKKILEENEFERQARLDNKKSCQQKKILEEMNLKDKLDWIRKSLINKRKF
jgi:hypothetical protein